MVVDVGGVTNTSVEMKAMAEFNLKRKASVVGKKQSPTIENAYLTQVHQAKGGVGQISTIYFHGDKKLLSEVMDFDARGWVQWSLKDFRRDFEWTHLRRDGQVSLVEGSQRVSKDCPEPCLAGPYLGIWLGANLAKIPSKGGDLGVEKNLEKNLEKKLAPDEGPDQQQIKKSAKEKDGEQSKEQAGKIHRINVWVPDRKETYAFVLARKTEGDLWVVEMQPESWWLKLLVKVIVFKFSKVDHRLVTYEGPTSLKWQTNGSYQDVIYRIQYEPFVSGDVLGAAQAN